MGIRLTFEGDNQEELLEAIRAYLEEVAPAEAEEDEPEEKPARRKRRPKKDEDEDSGDEDSGDEDSGEDDSGEDDAGEEDDEDALRKKIRASVVKMSKKEGGAEAVRAVLKKLGAPKLDKVPGAKLNRLVTLLKAANAKL